jgi:hypothetical protein
MIGWLTKARSAAGDRVATPARLRPSRDVLTAERDGLAVLLDLRREIYLTLDEAGTVIWHEVRHGASTEAVVDRLSAEFDAPAEVLHADAERFLADLHGRGLVVRS